MLAAYGYMHGLQGCTSGCGSDSLALCGVAEIQQNSFKADYYNAIGRNIRAERIQVRGERFVGLAGVYIQHMRCARWLYLRK